MTVMETKMAAKKNIEKEFLSTGTIAKRMDCSLETVRREIMAGRLKAQRWGRAFVVLSNDFEEYKAKYLKPIADV